MAAMQPLAFLLNMQKASSCSRMRRRNQRGTTSLRPALASADLFGSITLSAITGGTCRSLTLTGSVRCSEAMFCLLCLHSSQRSVEIPISFIRYAVIPDIPECSLYRRKINILSSSLRFHFHKEYHNPHSVSMEATIFS